MRKSKEFKKEATVQREMIEKPASAEDLIKLKNKLTKDELMVTALSFGHCVVLMYKLAKLEMPEYFSAKKESQRLARALRKQGRDKA